MTWVTHDITVSSSSTSVPFTWRLSRVSETPTAVCVLHLNAWSKLFIADAVVSVVPKEDPKKTRGTWKWSSSSLYDCIVIWLHIVHEEAYYSWHSPFRSLSKNVFSCVCWVFTPLLTVVLLLLFRTLFTSNSHASQTYLNRARNQVSCMILNGMTNMKEAMTHNTPHSLQL